MLPKSRILSVLLLGLGMALVAWSLLWPRVVGLDARIPVDLENTTFTLSDPDATLVSSVDPEVPAGLSYQVHFEFVPPTSDEETGVRAGVSMFDGSGLKLDGLLNASLWSYQMDRLTGDVTTPAQVSTQLASPTQEVALDGLWLKFPSGANRTEYQVWDPISAQSHPAVFVSASKRDSRDVFFYRQQFERSTPVQALATLSPNTTVTREFTVDRVSGLIVNMREHVEDANGEVLFDASLAQDVQDELWEQALLVSDGHTARVANLVLLGVGLVLVLVCLIGAYATGYRQRKQD